MKRTGFLMVAAMVAVPATAVPVYNTTATPTKANGDFIAGTGIPSDGFAVDTDAATGVSVMLKARERDTGNFTFVAPNRYLVQAGNSALTPTSPWWSVDLQFSPGDTGTIGDAYQLFLSVDFDPAFGTVAPPIVIGGTIPSPTSFSTIANPGPGAWSNDAVDFVVSESTHLGFAFWNTIFGQTYDSNALGEYTFVLTAKNNAGIDLAEIEIQVEVVPEPASLALLAAGSLMLIRRRRGA